jgi:hypothetical protein
MRKHFASRHISKRAQFVLHDLVLLGSWQANQNLNTLTYSSPFIEGRLSRWLSV